VKEKNSTNSAAKIKKLLDAEVLKRNCSSEISLQKLDPIMVAHRYKDEVISLICALFSYGNVKQIVKFLDSLDFSLLQASEEEITEALKNHYYRFQTSEDVTALFISLARLQKESSLEQIFKTGYERKRNVIDGIHSLITTLKFFNPHSSKGYDFLLSKVTCKSKGAGALKRWMMFLRWMVRKDNIDMGLWNGVDPADLIMPLDTHTFKVSQKLGLLSRKTYDLQAAIELTCKLKEFDASDPLKYDFALYRIGQEKIV
jgi:uncharacterized protein (TIGR02757 family)